MIQMIRFFFFSIYFMKMMSIDIEISFEWNDNLTKIKFKLTKFKGWKSQKMTVKTLKIYKSESLSLRFDIRTIFWIKKIKEKNILFSTVFLLDSRNLLLNSKRFCLIICFSVIRPIFYINLPIRPSKLFFLLLILCLSHSPCHHSVLFYISWCKSNWNLRKGLFSLNVFPNFLLSNK